MASVTVASAAQARSNYDFSDAVGYGEAYHKTPKWQRLGQYVNKENSPRSGGDHYDDGVVWSTDDGLSWDSGALSHGDQVTIRYDARRITAGSHNSDILAAWIDWDNDQLFDNALERVTFEVWEKDNHEVNTDQEWLDYANINGISRSAPIGRFFYSTFIVPETAAVGDTWLRARFTCSHSLPGQDPNTITPYGYLHQGEVEDYQLSINPSPPPRRADTFRAVCCPGDAGPDRI